MTLNSLSMSLNSYDRGNCVDAVLGGRVRLLQVQHDGHFLAEFVASIFKAK